MSKRHRQLKLNRYYHKGRGFCNDRTGCKFCYPPEPPDVCWCGAKNPYHAEIHGGCGGMGILNCICGGDLCVCHNHGEVECFGCPDCEDREDDDDCHPEDLTMEEYWNRVS